MRLDKQQIINKIKEVCIKHNNKWPGTGVLTKETGLKRPDWSYYDNLSNLVREAGYEPGSFGTIPYEQDHLVEKMIEIIREPEKIPSIHDLNRAARRHTGFPSSAAFTRACLANKVGIASKVGAWCQTREGYQDVAAICSKELVRKI